MVYSSVSKVKKQRMGPLKNIVQPAFRFVKERNVAAGHFSIDSVAHSALEFVL
ncbi:hypothetical protein [Comamonas sp. BIGb0124]|uniref:hypothetical protein n=1 Tax=Comamonas sp. BIGb0124 TaxID=2485130 RepID=UPI0013157554|nr:hypothetical protein [Comamonas sp. BIGb0124]